MWKLITHSCGNEFIGTWVAFDEFLKEQGLRFARYGDVADTDDGEGWKNLFFGICYAKKLYGCGIIDMKSGFRAVTTAMMEIREKDNLLAKATHQLATLTEEIEEKMRCSWCRQAMRR